MKRRVITACVFILFSLTVGFLSLYAVRENCTLLCKSLEELKPDAVSDNAAEVNRAAVRANGIWESKKTLFHILTNHTELSDFEISFEQMVYNSEIGNIEQTAAFAEECCEALYHIKRSSEPSADNIF